MSARSRARTTGSRSAAGLGGDGQRRDLGVGRERQQRVVGGLQPDEQPDGPRRHLRPDGEALGDRGLNPVQQIAPLLGMAMALRQRE